MSLCDLLIILCSTPRSSDITVMVEWALKHNYLSVVARRRVKRTPSVGQTVEVGWSLPA